MAEPTNVATKQGRTLQLFDGAGIYLTLPLVQDVITVANEGDTNVEARHRDEHLATPIVLRTKSANMTGSASFLLSADYGGTAAEKQALPNTWMTRQRAQAAGLTSTLPSSMAVYGAWAFGMRVYDPATNSTKTYRYVCPEKPTDSFENDLLKVMFNFTDYEDDVTITSGNGIL